MRVIYNGDANQRTCREVHTSSRPENNTTRSVRDLSQVLAIECEGSRDILSIYFVGRISGIFETQGEFEVGLEGHGLLMQLQSVSQSQSRRGVLVGTARVNELECTCGSRIKVLGLCPEEGYSTGIRLLLHCDGVHHGLDDDVFQVCGSRESARHGDLDNELFDQVLGDRLRRTSS